MNTVKFKLSTIFMLTILMLNAKAAIFLVNNTPGGPGQYTQIDPAIAVAADGDTIYVSGSSLVYSNCTITKSLTFIGSGSFTVKDFQFKSMVQNISINSNITGVKIQGFTISALVAAATTNLNNVDISYNNFHNGFWLFCEGLINCTNWNIHNNIFSGQPSAFNVAGFKISSASGCSNFVIQNNIYHWTIELGSVFRGFNFPNGVIQNNTIIFANQSAVQFFSNVSDALIQNNIFYNTNPNIGVTNCLFVNNISYDASNTLPLLGGTNIDNTDPQFVNLVSVTGGFDINNNYNVSSSGPAHNASTDLTDLGFYGGPSIIDLSPRGEINNMPVIRQMFIQNFSVPQNGNVNVKVRSTKARVN